MRVLMITIGYPPKQVGGTEVYVFGLVEELKQKGQSCSIVYLEPFEDPTGPEIRVIKEEHLGTPVHVVQVNTTIHKLEFVIFDAPLRAKLIEAFRSVVDEVRPDVIHVHPLQLGFDSYLIEDFNRAGHKVVLTFHSSTTTCARGDLIYMGKEVCDGLVLQDRCTKCMYHWKSVPAPVAAALSKLPLNWYESAFVALEDTPSFSRVRSLTSIPLVIAERRKSWTRATTHAKAVVAVCDWVRETIVKNDVSPRKVVSSRHGLRLATQKNGHQPTGIPRFGYLGRISPEKGIQSLLDALARIPREINFEFEFCSSSFSATTRSPEGDDLVKAIVSLQRRDKRIRILDSVGDSELRQVLSKWDALVVPSLWLESGPQVIYESFAAHTPIIGSRLGGIAELVKDRETGFLFTPGKTDELVKLLQGAAMRPDELRSLRANIKPVRTTSDVANDMLAVYLQHTQTRTNTWQSIEDLISEYNNTEACNDFVHSELTNQTWSEPLLRKHRRYIEENQLGFGDPAFHQMWSLILRSVTASGPARLLEIGVYKGQVISLWSMLLKHLNRSGEIHAITPLRGAPLPRSRAVRGISRLLSSRFRERLSNSDFHVDANYAEANRQLFEHFDLDWNDIKLHQGLSTDPLIKSSVANLAFDVIYVDGDHTYAGARSDFQSYAPLVKRGGFLVADDAGCYLPGTSFWKGLPAVSEAAKVIPGLGFKNVLNVGHNCVFQRVAV